MGAGTRADAVGNHLESERERKMRTSGKRNTPSKRKDEGSVIDGNGLGVVAMEEK
jgi:hypothetical protein